MTKYLARIKLEQYKKRIIFYFVLLMLVVGVKDSDRVRAWYEQLPSFLESSVEMAKEVLENISGLERGHVLYDYILPFYQLYLDGVSIREMKQYAETFSNYKKE